MSTVQSTANLSGQRSTWIITTAWVIIAIVFFLLAQQPYTPKEARLQVNDGSVRLLPSLWLPTIGTDPSRLLGVGAFETTLPLYWIPLTLAIFEVVFGILDRQRSFQILRILLRAFGILLIIWSFFGHEPFWDFVLMNIFPTSPQLLHPSETLIEFVQEHLDLVLVSSLLIVPIGLLLGIAVTRDSFREFLPLVMNIVNSGQTVPSIAVIALVIPLLGIGFWPTIFALVIYGLLPVVRNTVAGLEAVDSAIVEAAKGVGMTPTQILLQVELPLATPVIMAGIRTSMVTNVGTAAIGAFAGSGGLGVLIVSGLSMVIGSFVLLGALPAAILAILLDYLFSQVERTVTPRGLTIS